ncbi:ATPase, T2SS/T4P/T4SS family [Methylophaga sp.]|jgi:type II secretory ATPase GspE/PulE/Tfp pilus assembly ATPase PilB-like protein|uniref:GspE/PulE family protein n=1 Tax=Methylophaga sp. TaxID=2024840 RepID=UPI000C0DC82B|nr:ATPase, T2SS/T4P/T4SS family [Methylophaga sp.]MBL1457529.1 Flp pilus assembly complex ATPase component TadA [Methylophaga sp.]
MAIREKSLIEAAIVHGLINTSDRDQAKLEARRVQRDELTTLCYVKRLSISRFYHAFAAMQQLAFLRPSQIFIDHKRLKRLSPAVIRQFRILPVLMDTQQDQLAYVVTDSPDNPALRNQLPRLMKLEVELCVTDPVTMEYLIHQYSGLQNSILMFDAVDQVNDLLNEAYLNRASDVHIEPLEDCYLARIRIDGRLQEHGRRYTHEEGISLISRIKVMANIDIAETRMPQDGGAKHKTPLEDEFDLRIATAPTKYGERITIRLLGTDNQLFTLQQLGMSDEALAQFAEIIQQPHGIILITGPTGSGKSTTLYAALTQLKNEEVNILTAEDPVEMAIDGISQVQMNAKVNFASALRSFLRHDPDIIMVGEIRDSETGEIALKAATTGHLVLSTLHTNSAISSITRLRDIGLEPFLIASSLLGVIAQRLARRLCQQCRETYQASDSEKNALNIATDQPLTLWQPKGCPLCGGNGYQGRIALFETFWMDDEMEALITEGADELTLRKKAKHFTSLADDGREKVLQGLTTIQELKRLGLIQQFEEVAA